MLRATRFTAPPIVFGQCSKANLSYDSKHPVWPAITPNPATRSKQSRPWARTCWCGSSPAGVAHPHEDDRIVAHLSHPGDVQEPAHLARVVIEVPDWVAVCFAAPTVRTWRDVAGQPNPLSHLGPDLCLPNVDIDLVVERVANIAETGTSIAEVLLDQRIAAGIGNVYKSEALWACQVSPFTPIELVEPETRKRLFATASRQLQANLMTPTRTTVPGSLAVYGRRRQPCRRCRTAIQVRNHGDQARSTYWCPSCQPLLS